VAVWVLVGVTVNGMEELFFLIPLPFFVALAKWLYLCLHLADWLSVIVVIRFLFLVFPDSSYLSAISASVFLFLLSI
jgi:hypothetical protein